MSVRTLLIAGLLALGLALILWPSFSAPVVLWGDSVTDLQWARQGFGVFRPAPAGGHPAKPLYLLFLRAAMALPLSREVERRVVILQSLLLWLSITAIAYHLGRRRGPPTGIALYVVLILFLRLRDAASAVMTEALAAALFLAILAFALEPPRNVKGLALLGALTGSLFWIRPNVGAAALLLLSLPFLLRGRWMRLLAIGAGFAGIAFSVWIASRPSRETDRLRGLSFPILEASADYYWRPSIEWPSESPAGGMTRKELSLAAQRWRATLSARGPDARRQLFWRAFHGLLGTDFYDARWSPLYRRLTTASRIASPFALLASIAILVVVRPDTGARRAKLLGMLLILVLVAQDLVLGSNPRYALPFLPALLLLSVSCFPAIANARIRASVAALVFFLFVLLASGQRGTLDWQWGMIESAGVTIHQPIPRGGLPPGGLATLHVRIAAPLIPTSAQIALAVDGRRFWSSEEETSRGRPEITVPLPSWLLEQSARQPVDLELTSMGSYTPYSYLLFPVIPQPWERIARREGDRMLSPATGVRSGALDWWAHVGSP